MGRQVHREYLVPGHTEGKLPGKMNKGAGLLIPGSRDTDGKTHGHLGIPQTAPDQAMLADPE